MKKLFLLISIVVLVSGCEEKDTYESYDISFRDFDRDVIWSRCVIRKLKEMPLHYNNPLYNKAIDIECVYYSLKIKREIAESFKDRSERDG